MLQYEKQVFLKVMKRIGLVMPSAPVPKTDMKRLKCSVWPAVNTFWPVSVNTTSAPSATCHRQPPYISQQRLTKAS